MQSALKKAAAASEPWQLGLIESAAMLQAGKLSAVELVKSCLDRIDTANGGEPSFDGSPDAINAWARIYPDYAIEAALASDRRRAEGEVPLLNGIPIGVKDIFGVAGLPLTASSRVLESNVAEQDSVAFARLRSQGIVLVGHTHAHEFANGVTSDQVGNPYDLSLSAGGSSSGSGAALAARMVSGALGTDTGGSLRVPAALCGVSTVKPTHGLIPLAGVIPLAPSRDTVGPMARTVADCAVLLQAMAAGGAETTPLMPPPAALGSVPIEPRSADRPLRGVRIAITDRPEKGHLHPDVADGYRSAWIALTELGAEVIELRSPVSLLDQRDLDMLLYPEAWVYHQNFFPRLADKYRPQVRRTMEEASRPYDAARYLESQERRAQETWNWDRWFVDNKVDAILEPTLHYVSLSRGNGYDVSSGTGDLRSFSLARQWNLTGYPVISLPTGLGSSSGLPVSVSLIARRGDECNLTQIAIDLQESRFPVPAPRGV